MAGHVRLDRSGSVAHILIDNPSQRNALTPSMLAEIAACLSELEADVSVRSAVLRGVDGIFSSGYAIDHIHGGDDLPYPDEIDDICQVIERSRIVVVAAIERFAVGAALDVIAACDFRFATKGARFGITPAKLGLVYSTPGVARLVRVIGMPAARELFLTGRLIEVERALGIGLVDGAYHDSTELEAALVAFSEELLALSPLSLAGTKRILFELSRASLPPEDVAWELHDLRVVAMDSSDAKAARIAFAEKVPARFEGR